MKKKIVAMLLIATSVVTLAGCGGKLGKFAEMDRMAENAAATYDSYDYSSYYDSVAESGAEYEEAMEAPSSAQAETVTETGATTNRKLIRTVDLNVETYEFDNLNAAITKKVSALGGYIESSSVDGGIDTTYSSRHANYTIRIPAANADAFIATVEGSGNVTHHNENMEDVTLTYVDIKSRKESLQVEYNRLEEMIKNADDIEELIYIEERLANVRYEIQSIESQMRTYDNKVDYTTVYLYISEVKEYTAPEPEDDSVFARIARGLVNAGENIVTFLGNLIVFIVVAIPYLILIAIFAVIIFFIVKGIRKCVKKSSLKRAEKKASKPARANYVKVDTANTDSDDTKKETSESNE